MNISAIFPVSPNIMNLKLFSFIFLLSYSAWNIHAQKKSSLKLTRIKNKEPVLPCESDVYCHGPILDAVQRAKVHNDSKTFVDRPLKVPVDDLKKAWEELTEEDKVDASKLGKFLDEHFGQVGEDLEEVKLSDWKPARKGGLPLLNEIADPEVRVLAEEIHKRWNSLGRKVNETVALFPAQHSLIYLPHPFIVAGGRYQEVYYWDSYWVIQGLLVSGMQDTARKMVLNFVKMIEDFGHVPNGNRVYYQKRSQPPLLAMMVDAIIRHPTFNGSETEHFLEQILPALEMEHEFWMRNRSVNVSGEDGKTVKLNVYKGGITTPRPEGYREDLETAHGAKDPERVYAQIAAAAESGWDFSSRWLESPASDFSSIRTEEIAPVDLNSFVCAQASLIASFYKKLNDTQKAKKYEDFAATRAEHIHQFFWDESQSMWRDFDVVKKVKRTEFYLGHLAPVWTNCLVKGKDGTSKDLLNKILASEDMKNITGYPGGMPASRVVNKCCQWDFPNAWPNLQLIAIESFASSPDTRATALEWARKWLNAVKIGYKNASHLYEKYDVLEAGKYGGGGEYTVQEGFGWTNGGVLRLLELFPELRSSAMNKCSFGFGSFLLLIVGMYFNLERTIL